MTSSKAPCLSEANIAASARFFSLDPMDMQKIDGFSTSLFRSGDRILKVYHGAEYPEAQLRAQLRFEAFLHAGGLPMPGLIEGRGGEALFTQSDGAGGVFLTRCQEWMAGRVFEDVEKSAVQLMETGRALATLHLLSIEFSKTRQESALPTLSNNDSYDFEKYLPEDQRIPRQVFHSLLESIHKVPKDPLRYGLTHSDCHDGNILVSDKGRVTLIDFDDCEYHYFLNDLAIMVYTFFPPDGDDGGDYAVFVFQNLVRGYLSARPLDLEEFRVIPLFLKFRVLMIHVLKAKMARLTGVDEPREQLDRRLGRIASGFADLDSLMEQDYVTLAREAIA